MLRPLHSKGILTLTTLLLAESISISNAVTSWNNDQQKLHGASRSTFDEESCPATASSSSSATSSSSKQPTMLRFFATRKSSKKAIGSRADCCLDCSHCMEQQEAARICQLARGGHLETTKSVTPYDIPLHLWKVIFQAILTAINVFCWLVPLKSKRISENKLGLSLANAFSAGVFLSLAFGHLIPECVAGFSDVATTMPEATPYLLVLGGYLLIFFVEKVAFDAHEILHEMEEGGHHNSHQQKPMSNGSISSVSSSSSRNKETKEVAATASSGRSAVILLGALAVHSVLEMMALGLSNSFGDCALLTLSIALHQPAESIALLVAFLKSGMPHSQVLQYLSIFSTMGPIGVALGMAVNEFAAPIVDSIMLAVVAGTFVYVGATEVIPEEWEDSEHKWKKFAALMSGIVSILAITQYTMSLGH